jgi:hypothetical protein
LKNEILSEKNIIMLNYFNKHIFPINVPKKARKKAKSPKTNQERQTHKCQKNAKNQKSGISQQKNLNNFQKLQIHPNLA